MTEETTCEVCDGTGQWDPNDPRAELITLVLTLTGGQARTTAEWIRTSYPSTER